MKKLLASVLSGTIAVSNLAAAGIPVFGIAAKRDALPVQPAQPVINEEVSAAQAAFSAQNSAGETVCMDDVALANLVQTEGLELTVLQTVAADDSEKQLLAARCNSDYGYQDIINNLESEPMQQLYEAIDEAERSFFEGSTDLSPETAYLAIPNDYALTENEILQTYTLYMNDHPLYYWMESSMLFSEDSIGIPCAEAYLTAEARAAAYEKLVSWLQGYDDYCSGMTANYSYASAVLYRLAQQIDYAYDDSGEPEEAAWAHSIAGIFDDAHGEAVCEGYAKAYQLLMNYFGVPNVYVVGNASGNTGEGDEMVLHAWNIVQMDDGSYYWVDPTWSDMDLRYDPESFRYGDGDGYTLTEIEDSNLLEDYAYRLTYYYFLKGDVFYDSHMPLSTENEGAYYQYALPEVSAEAYHPTDFMESRTDELRNRAFSEDTVFAVGDAYYAVLQDDGVHRTVEWEYNYGDDLGIDEYTVPSSITYQDVTYDVVSVRLDGFSWRFHSVIISEGVQYLEGMSAYDQHYLEKITIPSTALHISWPFLTSTAPLKTIEVAADNPYLTSVDGVLYNKDMSVLIRYPNASEITDFTVPDTVGHIYSSAFAWNQTLESITFNGTETMIDPYAFREMQSLSEIAIPASVSLLPRQVFCNNKTLSKIYLSAETAFSLETFSGCAAEIEIEDRNSCGYTYDGALYMIDEGKHILTHYPTGRKADVVQVREDTDVIEWYAFTDAEYVGKVVIPAGCALSDGAFFRSGVESLEIDPDNDLITYENGAIFNGPDQTVLMTYLGGCRNTSYVIPESVTTIWEYAFNSCKYLEHVEMSDNVTEI